MMYSKLWNEDKVTEIVTFLKQFCLNFFFLQQIDYAEKDLYFHENLPFFYQNH